MIENNHSTPQVPQRVVVLGASGFVGKDLCRQLKNADIPVLPLASAEIDLTQPQCVDQLRQMVEEEDAVVFASALTPDRGKDRAAMMKNVLMGHHFSQFLEQTPLAHLVHISSDAVYSDEEELIDETCCCNPSGLYGLGHLVRERMVQEAASKLGVATTILRLCAVYGPGDTHNSYGPNRFWRTAKNDRRIVLFGEGEEKRDHVFVRDVSRIISFCQNLRTEGVLNIATGTAVSFGEVAKQIAGLADTPVEIECLERKNPITHKHYDIAAVIKAFPTFRFTALEEGLATYFSDSSQGSHG